MSYEFTAPVKDPAAELDYGMDWSDWLDAGETIVGQPTVEPSPPGLTIDDINQANGIVSWWARGGILGQEYVVTCRITTSAGRIDERSVLYRIAQR